MGIPRKINAFDAWLVLLWLIAIMVLLVAWSNKTDAQQKNPYTVYRIPLGCLYVVGSVHTSLAVAFVPDQVLDGSNRPCDGAKQ